MKIYFCLGNFPTFQQMKHIFGIEMRTCWILLFSLCLSLLLLLCWHFNFCTMATRKNLRKDLEKAIDSLLWHHPTKVVQLWMKQSLARFFVRVLDLWYLRTNLLKSNDSSKYFFKKKKGKKYKLYCAFRTNADYAETVIARRGFILDQHSWKPIFLSLKSPDFRCRS